MSDKSGHAPSVEVDDPAAAFQRFKELGRKIMAVPKPKIDRKIAEEKIAKKRHRRR